jgi:opacity protein-like surface antigen
MSKSRWLVSVVICSLVAMPMSSNAQAPDTLKDQPQDFMRDVVGHLFGPHWNLFLHSGWTTSDRLVLQQAAAPVDAQRSLETSHGFNVGGGAGVDILMHMGLRMAYTYTSSDLNFTTDHGNGSNTLDINGVGTLQSHTVALEVMRYMLPARSAFNPYGTLGVQGTWWQLSEKSPLVRSSGGSPFAVGPLFSFGAQIRAADHWSGRLEMAMSSGHNPFTGSNSFRALSGPTIDEPTGLSRIDFRIAGVYHFDSPRMPASGGSAVARN